jgi:hypothetical protein
MLAHCHQGPPAARVTSVTASDWNEIPPAGFHQLPSR